MARVPRGMVSLLVADTGRALAWERGLKARGIEGVQRLEAPAERVDQGEWQIVVPEAQASAARRYMQEVLQGEERLPGAGLAGRSPSLRWAMAAITALLLIAVALSFCLT